MAEPRRFPPPWSARAGLLRVVRDPNGHAHREGHKASTQKKLTIRATNTDRLDEYPSIRGPMSQRGDEAE
jgi:hypothetical protein